MIQRAAGKCGSMSNVASTMCCTPYSAGLIDARAPTNGSMYGVCGDPSMNRSRRGARASSIPQMHLVASESSNRPRGQCSNAMFKVDF